MPAYNPPAARKSDIIFEDEYLLALNKPSGLLSVPGRGDHLGDCAELRAKAHDRNARTVHRLDMDTSGILLFGKGAEAHRRLSNMFAERKIAKRYLAWVAGLLSTESGEIDLPLCVDWPNRPLQKVDLENGKPSLTFWQVLERRDNATLLALSPKTGRTHQLRVHCMAIGHPILGDRFYADQVIRKRASRLQLHAERLELRHPMTDEEVILQAPSDLSGPESAKSD
ncbi:RluA family pseudouridine synthase [Sneathiella litorea]|uniref:Pseudouridine synthase n=1 Tax=Sneathiella litorea TaxID=2606216 RepID=A0A6L8W564_9PROT|nr:RluA family pseudouridine synthase [Sneathiella litorea]MZR30266.1 RluA family pseudouridine synthase [Sneathiella litorea]